MDSEVSPNSQKTDDFDENKKNLKSQEHEIVYDQGSCSDEDPSGKEDSPPELRHPLQLDLDFSLNQSSLDSKLSCSLYLDTAFKSINEYIIRTPKGEWEMYQKELELKIMDLVTEGHANLNLKLLADCFANLYVYGKKDEAVSHINVFCDILTYREDVTTRVSTLDFLKFYFTALSSSIAFLIPAFLTNADKKIRIHDGLKKDFFELLSCMASASGSMIDQYSKEIYRVIKPGLTDRNLLIKIRAIECLTVIAEKCTSFPVDADTCYLQTVKAMEDSETELQRSLSMLCAALVCYKAKRQTKKELSQCADIPLLLKSLQSSFTKSCSRKGQALNTIGLSVSLMQSTTGRGKQVRYGLALAYCRVFTLLGSEWLARNLDDVTKHIVGLNQNQHLTTMSGSPSSQLAAAYESVACTTYILDHIASNLLDENTVVSILKTLVSCLETFSKFAEITPVYYAAVFCLQAIGFLILKVGTVNDNDLVNQLEPVLYHFLESTKLFARLSSAWCLKCLLFSYPERQASCITKCLEILKNKSSNIRATHGYGYALVALSSLTSSSESLGIPYEVNESIFTTCENLIILAYKEENSELVSTQKEVAWTVISTLSIHGNVFFDSYVENFFRLLKLDSDQNSDASSLGLGEEFKSVLRSKCGALVAIYTFLLNNESALNEIQTETLIQYLNKSVQIASSVVINTESSLFGIFQLFKTRVYKALLLLPPTTFSAILKDILQLLQGDLLNERMSDYQISIIPQICSELQFHIGTTYNEEAYTSILKSMTMMASSTIAATFPPTTMTLPNIYYYDEFSVTTPDISMGKSPSNSTIIFGGREFGDKNGQVKTVMYGLEDPRMPISSLCEDPCSISHHLNGYNVRNNAIQVPSSLPPTVALNNASIQLFGNLFAKCTDKQQVYLIEVFAFALEKYKGTKILERLQLNCLGSFLYSIQSYDPATQHEKDYGALERALPIFYNCLLSNSVVIRIGAAECVGHAGSLLKAGGFIPSIIKYLFEKLKVNRDADARLGYILALGCVIYQGARKCSGSQIEDVLNILSSLTQDPSTIVNQYALHSLFLITESKCYLNGPTLYKLLNIFLSCLYSPSAISQSNGIQQFLGRNFISLLSCFGPDLLNNPELHETYTFLYNYYCCQRSQDMMLIAAQLINLFIIVDPNLIVENQDILPRLLSWTSSSGQKLRHISLTGFYSLLQRSVKTALMQLETKNIDIGKILLHRLNKENDQKTRVLLEDCISFLLTSIGEENVSPWINLCSSGLNGLEEISSIAEHKAEVENLREQGSDEDGEDEDDAPDLTSKSDKYLTPRRHVKLFAVECLQFLISVCKDASTSRIHFSPRLISKESRENRNKYLGSHVERLVQLSFLSATSELTDLSLAGLGLLQSIIDNFGNVSDPDYKDTPFLEQYEAQINSALRSTFLASKESDMENENVKVQKVHPMVLSKALRVCGSWCSSLPNQSQGNNKSILNIMTLPMMQMPANAKPQFIKCASSLTIITTTINIQEKQTESKIGVSVDSLSDSPSTKKKKFQKRPEMFDFPMFREATSLSLQVSFLTSWAEVLLKEISDKKIDFEGSITDELSPHSSTSVATGYLPWLAHRWFYFLCDFAVLCLPHRYAQHIDDGPFSHKWTRNDLKTSYFNSFWVILEAFTNILNSEDVDFLFKDKSSNSVDDLPSDSVYMLFGVCVKALSQLHYSKSRNCSSTSLSHSRRLSALGQLPMHDIAPSLSTTSLLARSHDENNDETSSLSILRSLIHLLKCRKVNWFTTSSTMRARELMSIRQTLASRTSLHVFPHLENKELTLKVEDETNEETQERLKKITLKKKPIDDDIFAELLLSLRGVLTSYDNNVQECVFEIVDILISALKVQQQQLANNDKHTINDKGLGGEEDISDTHRILKLEHQEIRKRDRLDEFYHRVETTFNVCVFALMRCDPSFVSGNCLVPPKAFYQHSTRHQNVQKNVQLCICIIQSLCKLHNEFPDLHKIQRGFHGDGIEDEGGLEGSQTSSSNSKTSNRINKMSVSILFIHLRMVTCGYEILQNEVLCSLQNLLQDDNNVNNDDDFNNVLQACFIKMLQELSSYPPDQQRFLIRACGIIAKSHPFIHYNNSNLDLQQSFISVLKEKCICGDGRTENLKDVLVAVDNIYSCTTSFNSKNVVFLRNIYIKSLMPDVLNVFALLKNDFLCDLLLPVIKKVLQLIECLLGVKEISSQLLHASMPILLSALHENAENHKKLARVNDLILKSLEVIGAKFPDEFRSTLQKVSIEFRNSLKEAYNHKELTAKGKSPNANSNQPQSRQPTIALTMDFSKF